ALPILQVRLHVAGERAAEQVREHQREDDRRHRDVEQLLGHVLDLEQRAPRVGEGRGDGRRPVGPVLERDGGAQRVRLGRAQVRGGGGGGDGHQATSSIVSSSSMGWPGGARNTASRLGCPSVNSGTTMPSSPSVGRMRATCSAPSSGTRAENAYGSFASVISVPRSRPTTSAARARSAESARRTCTAPSPTERLSSVAVPSAMTLPWSITAMRSASWSA